MCNENSFAWQENPEDTVFLSDGPSMGTRVGSKLTDLGEQSPTPGDRVLLPARGRESRLCVRISKR